MEVKPARCGQGSAIVRHGTIALKTEDGPTPDSDNAGDESESPSTVVPLPKDDSSTFSLRIPASGSDVELTFSLGNIIGKGSDGNVYKAYKDEDEYAVKITRKKGKKSVEPERAENEAAILKKLTHRNIIRLHEYVVSKNYQLMVMELAMNDLLTFVRSLSENDLLVDPLPRRLACQIAHGLAYAHSMGITHGDIKLENILVTVDADGTDLVSQAPKLLIGDWGFARDASRPFAYQMEKPFVGSVHYTAPEVLEEIEAVSPRSDCWSAGVVFYAMVYGRLPFFIREGEGKADFVSRMCSAQLVLPQTLRGSEVPRDAIILIKTLLMRPSTVRATMDRVVRMPWFANDPWCRKSYSITH